MAGCGSAVSDGIAWFALSQALYWANTCRVLLPTFQASIHSVPLREASAALRECLSHIPTSELDAMISRKLAGMVKASLTTATPLSPACERPPAW